MLLGLLVLLLGMPGGATATAEAAPDLVTLSYDPTVGPWQVQTLTVPGSVTWYVLEAGGAVTPTLALTAPACWPTGVDAGACAPDSVQAALEGMGLAVTVTGGPSASPSILGARYTLTFADPGQAALHASNAGAPVQVDCVRCLDTEAPGTSAVAANGAAVVFVHGGGFVNGSREGDGWPDMRPRFEAAGYRTFSINYRLPDVVGQQVTAQPFGDRCTWSTPTKTDGCVAWLAAAEAATQDVNDAVAWIRAQGPQLGFDPARVVVVGASAGAIAALQSHYGPRAEAGRPAATVSINGIMDTARISPGAGPTMLVSFAGVDPAYAGSFLVGVDAQQEDEDVVARGRAAGDKVLLRSYPGEGHGMSAASPYFDDVMATVLTFLGEQLRPDAPPSVLGGTWLTADTLHDPTTQMPGHPLGAAPRAIVGDFNCDHRDDVIWQSTAAVPDMIWFGSADGVLRDPKEWDTDFTTYRAAVQIGSGLEGVVADLDADGCSDVVWYDAAAGAATVWYGRSDGTFTHVAAAPLPPGLELRRLRRRAAADALLAVAPGSSQASMLVADAAGALTVVPLTATVPAGAEPVVGDFDGDGSTDIFWSDRRAGSDGQGRVWIATAVPSEVIDEPGPSIGPTYAATVADLGGDGADDLIWYDAASGLGSQVWTGGATGTFTVATLAEAPAALHPVAARGPAHHDAILLAWPALHAATTVHTDGATTAELTHVSWTVPDGARPVMADVDGDGTADVLWTT